MTFAAEWLSLREPYDLRARNAAVLDAVAGAYSRNPSVAVVDLACGTGSTCRALSPHLPPRQDWRLVDNDLSLLARAMPQTPSATMMVRTAPVDLSLDLEAALDGPVELVTTSALLDLVSEQWLERFVVEIAARNLPVYAALSYDGRTTFDPADALDKDVIAAVNRHQLTDKGFGPALGPGAAANAIARFEKLGYRVVKGASDWKFGADDREIQTEVIAGWAAAAREVGGMPAAGIANWFRRRSDIVAAGRSSITVGHVDFFARPAAALR